MTKRFSRMRPACRERTGAPPAGCVFLTRSSERLRGLLFRKPDASVRVLVPCNSVHTVGMKYDIDVAFLDKEGTVLAVHRGVGKRRRLGCAAARMTLERFATDAPWFRVGERVSLARIVG